MLIITGIFNETRNELSIYEILSRDYRQELASVFELREKMKSCRNSKRNFSSSYLHMAVMQQLYRYM